MEKVRTTLKLNKALKKAAEKEAIDRNITLQKLFNEALYEYLNKKARDKAKKLIFHDKDMGADIDNLTRDDIYGTPKF